MRVRLFKTERVAADARCWHGQPTSVPLASSVFPFLVGAWTVIPFPPCSRKYVFVIGVDYRPKKNRQRQKKKNPDIFLLSESRLSKRGTASTTVSVTTIKKARGTGAINCYNAAAVGTQVLRVYCLCVGACLPGVCQRFVEKIGGGGETCEKLKNSSALKSGVLGGGG